MQWCRPNTCTFREQHLLTFCVYCHAGWVNLRQHQLKKLWSLRSPLNGCCCCGPAKRLLLPANTLQPKFAPCNFLSRGSSKTSLGKQLVSMRYLLGTAEQGCRRKEFICFCLNVRFCRLVRLSAILSFLSAQRSVDSASSCVWCGLASFCPADAGDLVESANLLWKIERPTFGFARGRRETEIRSRNPRVPQARQISFKLKSWSPSAS